MATKYAQALWREGYEQRTGVCYDTQKPRTRYNLDLIEIIQIQELRKAGNTLRYIAKVFGRSIEGIRRHCMHIHVASIDFDRLYGRGGNKNNHPKGSNHPWHY